MLLSLLHNLGLSVVEDGDPVNIHLQDLEGQEIADLDLMSDGKSSPTLIHGSSPIVINETHLTIASSIGLRAMVLGVLPRC